MMIKDKILDACIEGNQAAIISIMVLGYKLDFVFCLKVRFPVLRFRAISYDLPEPRTIKMYHSSVSITFMEMFRVIIYNKNWNWRKDALDKGIKLLPSNFF